MCEIEVVNDGSSKAKETINYLRERKIDHEVIGGDQFFLSLNYGGVLVFDSADMKLIINLINFYKGPSTTRPDQPFA